MSNNNILKIGILMIFIGAIILLISNLIVLNITFSEDPDMDIESLREIMKALSYLSAFFSFIMYAGIAVSFFGVLKSFSFQELALFRKPESLVEEVSQRVQKEATKIRCSNCKNIIEIESDERPITVVCPYCDAKGELR